MYTYIATYYFLIKILIYFWEVYEHAVWIKMFHMTLSKSHRKVEPVQQVYSPQQS